MELIGYNYYDFAIAEGDGESYSRTIAFGGSTEEQTAAELEITFADKTKSSFTPL